MTIRIYSKKHTAALFELIQSEGNEWEGYYSEEGRKKYEAALDSSIAYLAYEEDKLCGYCRCRDDDGFGIYVYDLLVDKKHRGKQIGHKLMSQVCRDFPEDTVYVTFRFTG